MLRKPWKTGLLGLLATVGSLLVGPVASAQDEGIPMMMQSPANVRTLDDLVALSAPQLEQLYRQAQPGPVPPGKVKGRALYPDARFGKARSKATKLVWQGKVFDPATNTAVNRFFGVRAIKGNVYTATSWLDGQPSMILDYQGTSRVYGNYRDEIRQVAPGLYLGLMYARTDPSPTMKMYFAFDSN